MLRLRIVLSNRICSSTWIRDNDSRNLDSIDRECACMCALGFSSLLESCTETLSLRLFIFFPAIQLSVRIQLVTVTATKLTAQTLCTKTILKLIAKTLVAFVKEVSLLELRGKTSYGRMMSMLS